MPQTSWLSPQAMRENGHRTLVPQMARFAVLGVINTENLLVFRQSVDVTVAWAKHAISQFLQPKLDTTGQFSGLPQFEISGKGLPGLAMLDVSE